MTVTKEALETAHKQILSDYRIWVADNADALPAPNSSAGQALAKIEAVLSSRSAEAGKPAVTQEMIDRLVDAEVDDVLSNSDGGAPSIEKQKLLTREIDDARKAIEAALSTPADIEPVVIGYVRSSDLPIQTNAHVYEYPFVKGESYVALYAAPVADREPVSVPEGEEMMPVTDDWTLIKDAPRDGRDVLLTSPVWFGDALTGGFHFGAWRQDPDPQAQVLDPTHFMLIPELNVDFSVSDEGELRMLAAAPQPNPSKVDADEGDK